MGTDPEQQPFVLWNDSTLRQLFFLGRCQVCMCLERNLQSMTRLPATTSSSAPRTGQYSVCGSLGEQKESTRQSYKGFGFGGSGVARDMTLPTRWVSTYFHVAEAAAVLYHRLSRPEAARKKTRSVGQVTIWMVHCEGAVPYAMYKDGHHVRKEQAVRYRSRRAETLRAAAALLADRMNQRDVLHLS